MPMGDTLSFFVSLGPAPSHARTSHAKTATLQDFRNIIDAFGKALQEQENTVTFRDAADFSMEARTHRRPSTVADLRSYICRMCNDCEFADKPIRRITISECRNMLLRNFGHSAHSYRKAQSILHSIFNHACRQRWCDFNPAKAILRPPVNEQRIEILTIEEIRHLLRKCREQKRFRKMEAALRLMLWCGIRPAEVRRLRWDDIDHDEKLVYIESQNSKTGGARAVPLRGGAKQLLNTSHPAQQFIAPKDWNRLWKNLRLEAGFTNWQSDALRHTFASMHLKRFHNLPLLQEEMGHRNSTLLQTRYLNLRHLRKRTAIDFFESRHWS